MNFKDFVPKVAQSYLNQLIQGTSDQPGLSNLVEQLDKLIELEAVNNKNHPKELLEFGDEFFRSSTLSFSKMKQDHLTRIATLTRLGEDNRMKDAYGILLQELSNNEQWNRFLWAAWSADREFKAHKEELKTAQTLAKEIGNTADKLSQLLVEFQSLDLQNRPREFYDVRQLLNITDNTHTLNYHFDRWRNLRPSVIGQHYPAVNAIKYDYDESNTDFYLIEEYQAQLEQEIEFIEKNYGEAEAKTHLAWCSAPHFSKLLKSLSKAASEYSPAKDEVTNTAIKSRKSVRKTQYIRAFGQMLFADELLPQSKEIKKAISIVANVVLDDPEIDVSYDDVRKALD